MTTLPKIVVGAMTFGAPGQDQARIHDLGTVQQVLDLFKKYGSNEIDTARAYGGGSSEEYLSKLKVSENGWLVATKLHINPKGGYDHTDAGLAKGIGDSLTALGMPKVDMYYLHQPDHGTEYELTLAAIYDLFRRGKFSRFALSNFSSWEVAQICTICKERGYIVPTVYQGRYNIITRNVEEELFPCLRRFNIAFYAYNPLAGGLLTGRYSGTGSSVEHGSRFDETKSQGKQYRDRFWNDQFFQAVDLIRQAAEKHGLSMPEVALRWLMNHSKLSGDFHDAIIVGASSVAHFEQNLEDLHKGPLPDDIIEAADQAAITARPVCPPYFR